LPAAREKFSLLQEEEVKKRSILVMTVVALIGVGSWSLAAEQYIYPAKGQSQQQLEKDKSECYRWAVQQSGFDPMAPPRPSSPPPAKESPQGGLLRGAAVGALVGVAGGAIAGDAGKGAAIGAATGGIFGTIRRHRQVSREEEQQQQWAQQENANYQRQRSDYNRAFKACMEGRGYTVK
jgi:hypothetical protein